MSRRVPQRSTNITLSRVDDEEPALSGAECDL